MSSIAQQPRHRRSQDHPRLRRRGAEPRAAEAAAGADRRRHPRRRTRRLERLEGPAAARALLRDRAGGRGRPHPAEAQRARRGRPGGTSRRRSPIGRQPRSSASSSATIPTTGCAPTRARPGRARQAAAARPRRKACSSPADYTTDAFTAITELYAVRAQPSAAAGAVCRRLRGRGRQYLRAPTSSTTRDGYRARHLPARPRVRRGRGRAAAGDAASATRSSSLLKGEAWLARLMAARGAPRAADRAPSRWRRRCSSTTRSRTSSP